MEQAPDSAALPDSNTDDNLDKMFGSVKQGARRPTGRRQPINMSSGAAQTDGTTASITQDDTVPTDMAAEVKAMIARTKDNMYNSWAKLEDLNQHINKSGDRLTKSGMRQLIEQTRPEAWLNKQTDDLQTIWELLSNIERTFETSKQVVVAFKARVP